MDFQGTNFRDKIGHCPDSGRRTSPRSQFVSAEVNKSQCPVKAAMPWGLPSKHPAWMEGSSQLWITVGSYPLLPPPLIPTALQAWK